MNSENTNTTIVPAEEAYEMITVTQDAIVIDVHTPTEFEANIFQEVITFPWNSSLLIKKRS
ncbi:hypothetical protein [Ktedonobacter robiniae]|uniref:Uncharacterized protein n=1 Tax=Ktedonobacter robiniae TaxID=2778365 RepID=A0ABQ3V4U3_9CHLR|nr:hypothetical protein [Ktedonobacter robiniae]GHO60023.1 hypothetical protein KSB_84980 [Ktedonobacter robiniae]